MAKTATTTRVTLPVTRDIGMAALNKSYRGITVDVTVDEWGEWYAIKFDPSIMEDWQSYHINGYNELLNICKRSGVVFTEHQICDRGRWTTLYQVLHNGTWVKIN